MEKSSQQWKKVRQTKFIEFWVSDLGKCRKVDKRTGDAIETYGYYNRDTGYMQFAHEYVHRLVAEAFLKRPRGKAHVDHLNNDRTDNRAQNLEWTTRKANNAKEHARKMKHLNGRSTNHDGQVILATDGRETKLFKNGYEASRFLGCSHVLVYNALNRAGSARRAKGWTLEWIETPQA